MLPITLEEATLEDIVAEIGRRADFYAISVAMRPERAGQPGTVYQFASENKPAALKIAAGLTYALVHELHK